MRTKALSLFICLNFFSCSWAGMTFDGTGDYVNVPNPAGLNVSGNQLTLSGWVNLSDTGSNHIIIGKVVNNTLHINPFFQYTIHYLNANIFRFCIADSAVNLNCAQTSGLSIATGQWYHIAGTYEGTTLTIYVNGVAIGTNPGSANVFAFTSDVRIGANGDGTTENMNGIVEDVRVYSRCFSASEVQELFNSRSRLLITDSLIGWWPLDEGNHAATAVGTGVVLDRTGNGNAGTIVGNPVWRASDWINYP